jgi:hypothetical protein
LTWLSCHAYQNMVLQLKYLFNKQQVNYRSTYPIPFVQRGYFYFTQISSRR